MKKLILSVIVIISASALKAQSTYEPSNELVTKFNQQFAGATDAKWSKNGNVAGVGFQVQGVCQIAYYDQDGNLVANGRRISQDRLPMKVSSDFGNLRAGLEKKAGPYTLGSCYEFLKQSGNTEYVIMLVNSKESLIIVSEGDMTRITSREKKTTPFTTHDVIAKNSNK